MNKRVKEPFILPTKLHTILEQTRPLKKQIIEFALQNEEALSFVNDGLKDYPLEDRLSVILEAFCDLFSEDYLHHSMFLDGLGYMLRVGICSNEEAYKALCTVGMMYTKGAAGPINLVCSFIMKTVGIEATNGISCYKGYGDDEVPQVGSEKILNRINALDANNPRHLIHAALVWGANEGVSSGRMYEAEALEEIQARGLFRAKWDDWRTEHLVY